MNSRKKILAISTILIVFLSVCVFADQETTTMTWYVPIAKGHSVSYGATCSTIAFFFPENKAAFDSDIDGNASQILPYVERAGSTACQAAGTAGMVITNTGTSSTNIDANFAAALDTNTWLKVWKGDDSGCGTGGMGGWEFICSLSDSTTSPVTTTACKDFNSGNATVATRLITGLRISDTNELCFSGELRGAYLYTFAAAVEGGIDHNATWQTSTDVS